MKIFLVGFMGCGKTTIAKLISQNMGISLIDTDNEIEKETKKCLKDLVDEIGEDEFRRIEHKLLKKTCHKNENIIVSCGGGLPCHMNNMELMNRHGITIWIDSRIEEIIRRIKDDKCNHRFLFSKHFAQNSFDALFQKRISYYSKAMFVVKNNEKIEDAVEETEKIISKHVNIFKHSN